MSTTSLEHLLVLQEFRLHIADVTGEVARIAAIARAGTSSGVSLLTSVGDARDVATLRVVSDADAHGVESVERAALAPYVASWRQLKRYKPHVVESGSDGPPYYRLAVTESGINDVRQSAIAAPGPQAEGCDSVGRIGRLWIGAPVGGGAGLLVLVGHFGDAPFGVAGDGSGWPLPLSRDLGVRVYEGDASTIATNPAGNESHVRTT